MPTTKLKRSRRIHNPPNHRATCLTCRDRKVKCDEVYPVCGNCRKGDRTCQRLEAFLWAKDGIGGHGGVRNDMWNSEDPLVRQSTDRISLPSYFQWIAEDIDLLYLDSPSTSDQAESGLSPPLAYSAPLPISGSSVETLLLYYIDRLAPWYDLNDPSGAFAHVVPVTALKLDEEKQIRVLHLAILALSASHKAKFAPNYQPVAEELHGLCVTEMIPFLEPDRVQTYRETLLAAACLLRSYEILNASTRSRQHHLTGAFSLASLAETVHIGPPACRNLARAGIMNYLREDITVALEMRKPIRLHAEKYANAFRSVYVSRGYGRDDAASQANWCDHISWVLAYTINYALEHDRSHATSLDIISAAAKQDLPYFETYMHANARPLRRDEVSAGPFPVMRMLYPWQIAGLQYYYTTRALLALVELACNHTSPCSGSCQVCMYAEEMAREHARKVIGLAHCNSNEAARINAFGPLSFCGRMLVDKTEQSALIELLLECAAQTGFDVTSMVEDLQLHWRSLLEQSCIVCKCRFNHGR